jgi:hypothetical protein
MRGPLLVMGVLGALCVDCKRDAERPALAFDPVLSPATEEAWIQVCGARLKRYHRKSGEDSSSADFATVPAFKDNAQTRLTCNLDAITGDVQASARFHEEHFILQFEDDSRKVIRARIEIEEMLAPGAAQRQRVEVHEKMIRHASLLLAPMLPERHLRDAQDRLRRDKPASPDCPDGDPRLCVRSDTIMSKDHESVFMTFIELVRERR